MTTGQKISERRKALGLSQEDVAKRLLTKREAVARYELDYRSPSIEMLSRIATVLECSTADLLPNESKKEAT